MQTLKEGREVEKEASGDGGGDCIYGRFRSETPGACMEAIQGVSLSCARAYSL